MKVLSRVGSYRDAGKNLLPNSLRLLDSFSGHGRSEILIAFMAIVIHTEKLCVEFVMTTLDGEVGNLVALTN